MLQTPSGTANLWELVSVVKGLADTLLSEGYKEGIMHVRHLTKFRGVSILSKRYSEGVQRDECIVGWVQ